MMVKMPGDPNLVAFHKGEPPKDRGTVPFYCYNPVVGVWVAVCINNRWPCFQWGAMPGVWWPAVYAWKEYPTLQGGI